MQTSYEQHQDIRIIKTKKAIIDSFWNMLDKKSVKDISIKEICLDAEVNRSTFYLHFEDKQQLLLQSIYDKMYHINELAEQECKTDSIREYYKVIGDITFRLLTKNKSFYRKIIVLNEQNLLFDPAQSFLSLNINRHIKTMAKKENGLKLPSSMISEFYSGGIISLAKWWITTESSISQEKLNNLITVLLSSFLTVTDNAEID